MGNGEDVVYLPGDYKFREGGVARGRSLEKKPLWWLGV